MDEGYGDKTYFYEKRLSPPDLKKRFHVSRKKHLAWDKTLLLIGGIIHGVHGTLLHGFGKWYCQELCKREYQGQKTSNINERPAEYQFVFKTLAKVCPTSVLYIGTGKTALTHLIRPCGHKVTAIDNINDYWPKGMFNRHFHIIHDDITETKLKDTFDFIPCVSVLEHIKTTIKRFVPFLAC